MQDSSSSSPSSQFIQILYQPTQWAAQLYQLLQNVSFTTCVGNKSHFGSTDWQRGVIKAMVSNAGNYLKDTAEMFPRRFLTKQQKCWIVMSNHWY